MRFFSIILFVAAVVLLIFFLWGDSFSFIFSLRDAVAYLDTYERWAWAVAFSLLIADILLPLPGTIIMAALGYIYGPFVGGLLSVLGSFLSGAIGYWSCRMIGERAARYILGNKDYERGKAMSDKVGGLIVALSRWMPVFPEVVACMAGLTRMRPIVFHVALLCGSLPLGFVYAYIGFSGIDNPAFAMVLSAGVPPIIWLTIRWIFRAKLGVAVAWCLTCATPLVLQAQQNETTWYIDVTTTHVPADGREHALDVAFVDVDGDRDLDAVLALESEPNRLYLNDGKGKFTWRNGAFAEKNHDSEHVRIADFNRDGLADIIFVAEDDQTHEYYMGKGHGIFVDVSNRLPAKSEANGLDVGDVNGDGLPDIVIGNSGSKAQDFLWVNNPENPGYFIDYTTQGLPASEDQTQAVKLVDLNGDGALDAVVGNEEPPNRLLFNDGKGKFREDPGALELLVPLHTRDVLAFDANKDGHGDILFVNLTSNGGQWDKDPTARLLINDGKGNFKDETVKRIPRQTLSSYSGAIVDFNHDDSPDIILSAVKTPPFEAAQVQVLQNDGTGVFINVTNKVIPDIAVGRGWGIAVGDVNGDAVLDLMIGGWGSQVRLLLGKR